MFWYFSWTWVAVEIHFNFCVQWTALVHLYKVEYSWRSLQRSFSEPHFQPTGFKEMGGKKHVFTVLCCYVEWLEVIIETMIGIHIVLEGSECLLLPWAGRNTSIIHQQSKLHCVFILILYVFTWAVVCHPRCKPSVCLAASYCILFSLH